MRSDVDLMAVREATRSAAAAAGFSLVSQTKLVTAVSELARNAVVHGGGGEVRIDAVANGAIPRGSGWSSPTPGRELPTSIRR